MNKTNSGVLHRRGPMWVITTSGKILTFPQIWKPEHLQEKRTESVGMLLLLFVLLEEKVLQAHDQIYLPFLQWSQTYSNQSNVMAGITMGYTQYFDFTTIKKSIKVTICYCFCLYKVSKSKKKICLIKTSDEAVLGCLENVANSFSK